MFAWDAKQRLTFIVDHSNSFFIITMDLMDKKYAKNRFIIASPVPIRGCMPKTLILITVHAAIFNAALLEIKGH